MTERITLTPEETAFYEANGYVGPYGIDAPSDVATARRLVDELLEGVSPVYGVKSGRDWHLVSRPIFDVCAHPAILDRLEGLLGPDIVIWRSQLFYKKPGDGETLWHQDYSFPGPLNAASIDPPETVTAWIALDPTTIENGCVELVAGSHKEGRIATVSDRDGDGIFGRNYRLDRDVASDDRIAKMLLEPGQFFLFSNLLVHGSGPNMSETTRLGIGVRFAPASVRVYPGMVVDGQGMSLEKYGCVLVRGEDRFRHNTMAPPPSPGVRVAAAPSSSARDAGFKMGYGFGFTKGERHAEKGVRIDILQRTTHIPGLAELAKQYGDPVEFIAGIKEGAAAGYETGVEGRPFDARFGAPGELPGGKRRRGAGPIGKVLRGLKRLAKKF